MVVEIKNLVKRYNEVLAVDNVDISVKEGEILGLLGPNGAGKSTIINCIAGLIKIDGGEIRLFDKRMLEKEMSIKRDIGVVPQDIAVFEDLSAYDNLCYFGRLYGLRGSSLKERVREALEFTGLSDTKNMLPKKFSGGMKRRLNIACAIVHRPKLIIMDEPTVGIDPQSRNHILEAIRELNRNGTTIIYTSHYMEEVEEICTNIVIVDHGRVIARGTKEELKSFVEADEKVSIEISPANYAVTECIRKLGGVKDCVQEGRSITIISKKGSRNIENIMACVSKTGCEILSVTFEKPTLESVFLTLTGRKLRD
jgi:ABC-2 type transport system ATP-binding protein